MEKQTVFIKRYPTKGEFPKQDGLYTTNLSNLGTYYYYKKLGMWGGLQPNWWLEEIELPSEWDIQEAFNESEIGNIEGSEFHEGANFILNKLKGETK